MREIPFLALVALWIAQKRGLLDFRASVIVWVALVVGMYVCAAVIAYRCLRWIVRQVRARNGRNGGSL